MTKLLTDHLPLVSSAPNGVRKLRELILQLAVMGKLVSQDPNDEPASKLLKKIHAERTKKLKSSLARPMTDPSEKEFDLPIGWEWIRLSDSAETIQYGYTASADHLSKSIRMLRITDIQNDCVNWDAVPGCDIQEEKFLDYALSDGDIVIARTGGTIGKSYLVDNLSCDAIFASYLIRLKRLESTYPPYLKVFLGSQTYWNQLTAKSMGTGQPNVSGTSLKSVLLPFPPLAEQQRIVAKVEELMLLCDRLEAQQADAESAHTLIIRTLLDTLIESKDPSEFAASWERIEQNFDILFTTESSIEALKQTLVQLAVMGKLVRQDPKDEPAREFLKRLTKERLRLGLDSGTKTTKSNIPQSTGTQKLFPEHSNWVWTRFDDVVAISSGITLGKKLDEKKTVSMPYLRVANVQRGYLILDEIKEIEIYPEHVDKYLLCANDLLLTEGGDWDKVGRTAIWRDEIPECLHQNHIFKARRLLPELDVSWAQLYLNSPIARSYFAGSAKQTTNLASINMTQLRNCPFPLPPPTEQHRIVAKVNELMTLCDRLKAKLASAQDLQVLTATALIQNAVKNKTPLEKQLEIAK